MYYCEETREYIHPIFFGSEEEAREVREHSPDEEVDDASRKNFVFRVVVVLSIADTQVVGHLL